MSTDACIDPVRSSGEVSKIRAQRKKQYQRCLAACQAGMAAAGTCNFLTDVKTQCHPVIVQCQPARLLAPLYPGSDLVILEVVGVDELAHSPLEMFFLPTS